MHEQSYTINDKTITICTEQRDLGGMDSRGIVWEAWVKEQPGIHETNVERGEAVRKLKLNIPNLLEFIPDNSSA